MWTKWFILLIGISLIWTGNALTQEKPVGEISFLIGDKGDVTVKHKNRQHWHEARLYSEIWQEDQLQTQTESRCEVKLSDGSTIRIGEDSSFQFDEERTAESSWFHSVLKWGKVWVDIGRNLLPSERFEIQAPSAVCAVRGTIYAVEADSTTRISVFKGAVDVGPRQAATTKPYPQSRSMKPREVPGPTQVAGPFEVSLDQWIRIVAGFQIEIRPDLKYHKQPLSQTQKSDWVRWNQARDQLKSR